MAIDFPELTSLCIFNDVCPDVVNLTDSDGVGVAGFLCSSDRLVGHFTDVGPSHHQQSTGGADGIRHPVGAGSHSRHGSDPHQFDFVFLDEPRHLLLADGLGIPIDQEHLMLRWSQGFENEHPEMGHVVPRHLVIGVIEQDIHRGWRPSKVRSEIKVCKMK